MTCDWLQSQVGLPSFMTFDETSLARSPPSAESPSGRSAARPATRCAKPVSASGSAIGSAGLRIGMIIPEIPPSRPRRAVPARRPWRLPAVPPRRAGRPRPSSSPSGSGRPGWSSGCPAAPGRSSCRSACARCRRSSLCVDSSPRDLRLRLVDAAGHRVHQARGQNGVRRARDGARGVVDQVALQEPRRRGRAARRLLVLLGHPRDQRLEGFLRVLVRAAAAARAALAGAALEPSRSMRRRTVPGGYARKLPRKWRGLLRLAFGAPAVAAFAGLRAADLAEQIQALGAGRPAGWFEGDLEALSGHEVLETGERIDGAGGPESGFDRVAAADSSARGGRRGGGRPARRQAGGGLRPGAPRRSPGRAARGRRQAIPARRGRAPARPARRARGRRRRAPASPARALRRAPARRASSRGRMRPAASRCATPSARTRGCRRRRRGGPSPRAACRGPA